MMWNFLETRGGIGMIYTRELSDDLSGGAWTNDLSKYSVTGAGVLDAEFDSVTNQVPTDTVDSRFFRLRVEQQ